MLLKAGLESMGLDSGDDVCEKFGIYYNELEEKGRVMNLTAVRGWENVVRLHFLDCAAILRYAGFENKRVCDIGSGAGFPGLPIKICSRSTEVVMIDSLGKRVDFVNGVIEKIGAEGVSALHGRAEEKALEKDYRDSFDLAVSRAVARLNVLCELCLPYVKPGGAFIAMKSTDTEDEINEAKAAVGRLGGAIEKVEDYTVFGTDIVHRAVIIRKEKPTPKGYPRRFAKISKNPLK